MKKISFDREIYSYSAIKETINAYKHIAKMTVAVSDDKINITFLKCEYDEEITIKEFENYLIGVENS